MMYMYSLFFFILSLLFFFVGSLLYMLNLKIMMEWLIFYFNSMDFVMLVYIDYISLLFISVVFMISSVVLLYSMNYMAMDFFKNRFLYLLLLFVFSMFLMIISPSLLSILLGWDGLGLISYCLVIYYQNSMAYNSGMMTILCNRVGDVGILMSISLMFIYGSWNYNFYKLNYLIMFMLILASITKSAQIPFSPWLPAAMAAPTPISSLVHSSTLVTAGIYLMIRFNEVLLMSGYNLFLLLISSVTMFMAGIFANFEYDLKKIIALSTLSQLGLMMSILSMGFWSLSYFHLLTHAMFKSLLFLCAGIMIHMMSDNQDIRFYGGLYKMVPFLMISFFVANLSLCGFPFLAGFYSKDMIMEFFFMSNFNFMVMILLILSTVFTVSYTFRLLFFLLFDNKKFYSLNMIEENLYFNLCLIILTMFSVLGGSMLMWMFFYENLIVLSSTMKLMVLFLCMMGVFLGMYFLNLFLKNKFIKFLITMFYLIMFYFMIYMYPLYVSKSIYMNIEKGWLEGMSSLMFKKLMIKFYNLFKLNENMIFSIIKFMMIILLLVFLMI